ncbi:peptidoglycan-binding protein [Hamadaea tsunoensis]|uniref:peptidoglycan-binding protein n=1 Tax=Hamadaea tsunoensis TaxID=53368 RepID=UPI0004065837|nr:peptidoglycan-binding protein [Hamadaea tsunoensis]
MTETTTSAGTPDEPVAVPRSRRRRRRGKAAAGAAAVVVVAGAAAAATIGFGGHGPSTPAAAGLPPSTAQVTRQTLDDTQSEDGDLAFGPTTSLKVRLPGTVTSLPYSETVVARGKALYKVDNTPVVLMYGTVPAYRELGTGAKGADVRQLEQNLKALGYKGFTVDDKFTSETAAAVKDWQDDLGLTKTGRVELGRVVFSPGAVRVDSVSADLGGEAQPGQEVLAYTGTVRVVTVKLDVADQRLARKGAKVSVRLPDGKTVNGKIDRVTTKIESSDSPNGGTETKIEVLISLDDAQAVAGFTAASVHVEFTAGQRTGVLTVPVGALVALSEGGYGVEVVEGSATHYAKVETGLFANGRVEVTGDGIAEGTTVGMPR